MPSVGALVDDLLEQLHGHHALPALHLVARTEHALGVAEVGALDLDDVGESGRAVAAGGQEHPAHGLGVGRQEALGGLARPSRHGRHARLSPIRRFEGWRASEAITWRRISSRDVRRPDTDEASSLSHVGNAPRHVLETLGVRLVVRDQHDLRRAARHGLDPARELQHRDFLGVADVEDLADGSWLGGQLRDRPCTTSPT